MYLHCKNVETDFCSTETENAFKKFPFAVIMNINKIQNMRQFETPLCAYLSVPELRSPLGEANGSPQCHTSVDH